MRLREISNEFDNMKRVIERHAAMAAIPKPELVLAQIPGALKHSYDWGSHEEEHVKKLPGMSLADLIKKGCSLPWALPGLSGGVRAYYQRSYSWQLCDSFTEPFFWYQESGKLKFVDVCCEVSGFDELVKFSALGGWNLAH